MTLQTIGMIISIIISLFSACLAFYNIRRTQTRDEALDTSALEGRIDTLFTRMTVVEKQVEVFWRGVSFHAAQVLHSPHTPFLDRLLEAFMDNTLSFQDALILREELMRIINNKDGTKTKFEMLLARYVLLGLDMQATKDVVNAGHSNLALPPYHTN